MDPILYICQLTELRHFKLLAKIDLLSVILEGCV